MAEQKKPAKRARSQDSDLLEVISQAADTPTYRPLLDYLAERRAIPEIKQGYLGPSTSGEFSVNAWKDGPLPAEGRVRLSYGAGPNTLLHELTHAAQRQFTRQAIENNKETSTQTPAKRQFMEGYSKLMDNWLTYQPLFEPLRKDTSQVRMQANKIAPEFVAQDPEYRGSPDELQAFAVGDATMPKPFSKAPLHLSPTLATEFMILLDLAIRRQKETNAATPPPKTR